MRNYKLTTAYDGTNYQGWQKQSLTAATIQGILEQSLSEVLKYPVEIHGSGRTDAGVHAWGQIADVKLSGRVDETLFLQQVNEVLPEDIKITKMELVKGGFHARLSAKSKSYVYRIDNREKGNVFTRRYCYHYPKFLNITAMKEAASYLTGTHDFSAFTDKKDEKTAVRSIYNIVIEKKEGQIEITYHGSGFLYHMVRILTGTLMEVGNGSRRPMDMEVLLQEKKRTATGLLAPACGLCLKEVYYDEKRSVS